MYIHTHVYTHVCTCTCMTVPSSSVQLTSPVDSILAAMLTVSPNTSYLCVVKPTTPATTVPLWIPVGQDTGIEHYHIAGKIITNFGKSLTKIYWQILNLARQTHAHFAIMRCVHTCLILVRF